MSDTHTEISLQDHNTVEVDDGLEGDTLLMTAIDHEDGETVYLRFTKKQVCDLIVHLTKVVLNDRPNESSPE